MKLKRRDILVVAGTIALAAGIIPGIVLNSPSKDFPQGSPGPEVTVVIRSGEYGSSIASKLSSQGVIKNSSTFLSLIAKDSRGMAITPGAHRLQTHLPALQALNQLLDKNRNSGSFEVKEASTYQDVIKGLKAIGVDSTKKVSVIPYLPNPYGSLEGQLFPAIYSFAPKTPINDAISTMAEKFQTEVASTNLLQGYLKYSAYEVLTIASMVQIEGDPTDYSKVARVIYNRLKIGMPLQLNSTVQYAANLRGRIALSRNATKIQSPYNTYLHVGLPPTPISNPSTLAIAASLKPADGNWLYFITVAPHDTRFTNEFATFQSWTTLYNKNLAAGRFR